MPQSRAERFLGYVVLVLDTLLQRVINWGAAARHPLFGAPSPTLRGRVAVVTGANTGLGLETARWLARGGAHVVLACRSGARGFAAAGALRCELGGGASVEACVLDLGDLRSVRAFAAALGGRPLHALVLNAGVMAVPRAAPEAHMAVNHAGHALLLLLLAPNLAAGNGRAVLVSSLSALVADLRWDDVQFARRPYAPFTAYANSKLAQVLFARAVRKRLAEGAEAAGGARFAVACVHPGESTTDVARHLGQVWHALHKSVGRLFLLSPKEAARTSAFAAAAAAPAPADGLLYAVDRVARLPRRLDNDADAQRMWEETLRMIGVSDKEAMRMLVGAPDGAAKRE